MPVTLSIRNVPDDLAEWLRQRAKRHHRSLQGELMALLEERLREEHVETPVEQQGHKSLEEYSRFIDGLNMRTGSESTAWIREERSARAGVSEGTLEDFYRRVRAVDLETGDESTRWVRDDRDAR